jgi:hypothetical protein
MPYVGKKLHIYLTIYLSVFLISYTFTLIESNLNQELSVARCQLLHSQIKNSNQEGDKKIGNLVEGQDVGDR